MLPVFVTSSYSSYPSSYYYSPYSLSNRLSGGGGGGGGSSSIYTTPSTSLNSTTTRPSSNYYKYPSRPIYIDTATIDLTSSQLPPRKLNSTTAAAAYGKIHRGRTVVRLKTTSANPLSDVEYRPPPPPQSPGRKLVEKFTIPDRVSRPPAVAQVKVAHAGAIRRHLSINRRKPSLVTEDGIPVPAASRKCSISEEMLKEEEAIFDSLIMEEIARTNGIPDRRNSFDCTSLSQLQDTFQKPKRYSVDFNAVGSLKSSQSLSDFIRKFNADIAEAPLSPTESEPPPHRESTGTRNKLENDQKSNLHRQHQSPPVQTDVTFVLKTPTTKTSTNHQCPPIPDKKLKLKTKACQIINEQLLVDKRLLDVKEEVVQQKCVNDVSLNQQLLNGKIKVNLKKTTTAEKLKPMVAEFKKLPTIKGITPVTKAIEKPLIKSAQLKKVSLPKNNTTAANKLPAPKNQLITEKSKTKEIESNPQSKQQLKKKQVDKSAQLKQSANNNKSNVEQDGEIKITTPNRERDNKSSKMKKKSKETTGSSSEVVKISPSKQPKKSPLQKIATVDDNNNKVIKQNGLHRVSTCDQPSQQPDVTESKPAKTPKPINWKMVDVGRPDFDEEITDMNGLYVDDESESESEYTSSDEEDSEESSSSDVSLEDSSTNAQRRPYSCRHRIVHSHQGRVIAPASTIPRFKKYTVHDFNFIKVLGKGSFGKVLLAKLQGTEYYYAVKCLKKDVVLEDDDVECTLIERKVLTLSTKHPYLCHLFCTFQTQSHLFFVMEYLNGGDLMFHVQQSGRFDEGRARFYAAEIVSGMRFLHKKGIVYRDLKLDNILLDYNGHVRIADFGMCKLQIYLDKTVDTFCGTPDYMAPEILKGMKYNQSVDWWSFGILLYEMLVGQSPFSGCDEDQLFWSICNEQPQYPRYLSPPAKAILVALLEKEAAKRLGSSGCNSGDDVMAHDFFRGLDWSRLERRELEPPYKPRVFHPLDTHYFDRTFTKERPRLTPIEKTILESMDQSQFLGFSYTNPNATDC